MQRTTNEKNQFLNEEEIQILKSSSSISGIEGQRAKALLLVNSGMTQVATGNEVGLTRGQVKYVVAKYGRDGISAFQPSTTSSIKVKVEKTEEVVKEVEAEPEVKSEKKNKKEKKIKKDKKKGKKSKSSDKKSQPQPKKMKKADKKKKKDKKKDSSKKKDSKKKDSKKKDSKKKDKKKKK